MKTRILALLCLVSAVAPGSCARRKTVAAPGLPAGDAVWFDDSIGAADQNVEPLLGQGGFIAVFLPARRFFRSEKGWTDEALPAPAQRLERTSVHLIIRGDDSVQKALTGGSEAMPPMIDSLERTARKVLRDGEGFGKVIGIHLDFPFSPETAGAYASLVSALRAGVPKNLLVSVSLRFPVPADHLEDFQTLSAAVNGFVAHVFGEGSASDPVSADLLEKHWWAAYAPGARGQWQTAEGEDRGPLPEALLASFSDDARVHLTHDLTLQSEAGSSFQIRPLQSLSAGERDFGIRDVVRFRQPALSEMVYHLGADLAGRRFARGRVIVLSGLADPDRIFTLAALNDLLLGRRVTPDWQVATVGAPGSISVSAENLSAHTSVVSRTANWIEVEVSSGDISNVDLGGFDRFEVFGREGGAVTLGRASRVRFYETLIGAFEKTGPARIVVRRRPPAGCCTYRMNLLSAAGEEVTREGIGAPPTPTPGGRRKT